MNNANPTASDPENNQALPLSDAERAELEQLREEKRQMLEQKKAREERAELEKLRAIKQQRLTSDTYKNVEHHRGVAQVPDAHHKGAPSRLDAERQKQLSDPDLYSEPMPLKQKVILAILVVLFMAGVVYIVYNSGLFH